VVSFFPMILTTGIIFYRFNRTYTDKIAAHISELVQKHTHQKPCWTRSSSKR
jgi:two-component system NtrC family sensor kinase